MLSGDGNYDNGEGDHINMAYNCRIKGGKTSGKKRKNPGRILNNGMRRLCKALILSIGYFHHNMAQATMLF